MFALKAYMYEDKFSKFKFDMERVEEEPLCGCATAIPLYLSYYFIVHVTFQLPPKRLHF